MSHLALPGALASRLNARFRKRTAALHPAHGFDWLDAGSHGGHASTENLLAASKRAMKGKRYPPDVQAWAMREEAEVLALREELLSGAWQPGSYHSEISREGNTTGLRRAYMRWPPYPRLGRPAGA